MMESPATTNNTSTSNNRMEKTVIMNGDNDHNHHDWKLNNYSSFSLKGSRYHRRDSAASAAGSTTVPLIASSSNTRANTISTSFINDNKKNTSTSSSGRSGSRSSKDSNNSFCYYNTSAKITPNDWLQITSMAGGVSGNSGKTLESAAAVLQMNLPEDMRISKLLRRLCNEKNPNAAISLCDKLKIVIVDPNNTTYVRRSFDILIDSLISVLKDGPIECVNDVAQIIGQMGYVARIDFGSYKNWMIKMYKNQSLRIATMTALLNTLKMDAITRDLTDHSPKLMELLKDYLENAEISKLFIAITNVIQQFAINYPKAFEIHFTDIVDIVVGWHLETDQSVQFKQHCTELLQTFNRFWAIDLEFTSNLLGQFLEDIITCGDEIKANQGRMSPILDKTAPPELCFASLVGAYNSVLKCSWEQRQKFINETGGDMLIDSFCTISTVAQLSIQQKLYANDCILPVNEFIILILDCYQFNLKIPLDNLLELMRMQMMGINHHNEEIILSILFVALKIVIELKSQLPFEFIGELFAQSSALQPLKFMKSKRIYSAIIRIYHEVMNIKNVLMLQEAYRYILIDLGTAVQCLANAVNCSINWPVELTESTSSYSIEQSECTINFYLTALSSLAISNSSIIAMWALQPNILELLTNNLQAANLQLWQSYPSTHYAILSLVAVHCKKNTNFISSSNLINSESSKITDVFNKLSLDASSESPTSQHYLIILKFFRQILTVATATLNQPQLELTLEWCHQLIEQSAQYANILKFQSDFTAIIHLIAKISMQCNPIIQLCCANCCDGLQHFDTLNKDVQTVLAEICCAHMCSVSNTVRDRYSKIFARLPLNVTLKQVNEYTGFAKERAKHVAHYQHWHNSRTTYGDLRPQYFRDFIYAISVSNDEKHVEQMLQQIFQNCWYEEAGPAGEFRKIVLTDVRCLVAWCQWEAAQFCVNNKLRTPLGKPQDTFLKIESIIKEDARILALKEKTNVQSVEELISNHKHARVLMGFLEDLEKSIYNAADGTAFALPAAEKPAKTFFHINRSTCSEWFNRIRTAVDLVALHSMEPEMVIRYCQVVLKTMVDSERTGEPLFEHTLMSYAWALLRNGESDALYGLYVWTRAVTNRKFLWVKAAAEQASGHRESAMNIYTAIMATADEAKLDLHVRDFIADQLTLCYCIQHQWDELHLFLVQEESRLQPRVTIPLISITAAQVEATNEYFRTFDRTLLDLANWEILEPPPNIPSDFSCHKMFSLAENTVWQSTMNENLDINDETLKMVTVIIQNGLQECLRTRSHEHLNNLTIINHICNKVIQKRNNGGGRRDDPYTMVVDKMFGSVTLMRLLGWSEFLTDGSASAEQVNIDIRLDVCSMARKEGNLLFCKRELERFFSKSGIVRQISVDDTSGSGSLEKICDKLLQTDIDIHLWDNNVTRAVYETSKWLYCHADKRDAAIQFAASTTIGICTKIQSNKIHCIVNDGDSNDLVMRQRAAKYLLTLSEWIQGEGDKLFTDTIDTPLKRLVNSLPDIQVAHETVSQSIIPVADTAIGKIIHYSISQCPNLAKVWGALGNWCYRWGRKMVELRTEHGDKAAGLRLCDITAITELIPNASKDDVAKIVTILNHHHVPDDEEIGVNDICSTEAIETQLHAIPILANLSQEILHAIIEIWRQAHKSVYSYYEQSAAAYFKYLQLATTEVELSETDANDGDCSIVTATLRLLRLIVKHALGLQDVLEEGLATTPTNPWKVIIPQLFARLNHHEPYVRRRVSELLCRVANDSPHLIIFPAVVGSDQERCMDIADISMATVDLDLDDDDEKNPSNSGLTTCFNSLLDTLSKQAAETVQQVQLLVRELKRVTLLWDELWLIALAQVYAECSKRLANFQIDLNKFADDFTIEKTNLLIEKHRILMRPILFVMDRLHAITSGRPETANEQMFQEKYLHHIVDTIAQLKKPFNREQPNEAWLKFKNLYAMLQQRAHKRAACTLKMIDISPVLAQMSNTAISMPGVENASETQSAAQLIYIKSVDNIVHILPTKTKPKKLAFHGSDGRRYTYLFKGLEDLHLDERIMQFLSIANSMMSKSADCNGKMSKYRARHYSVIPLGPRSGLISWVDGTTPIFSLYKKWQQREAANPKKGKSDAIIRPAEMFINKLTPLLAEHNLKITDNRKEWPLSVLKQVLSELSVATPRDLLSKELWCYSTNAAEWRQVIRNYSQSIAVMSVIGYVIGLGDRHLDNILIELSSGEVLHIDYNVCFEKGKTLRVPEKVPFRMTPNLEEALGVTGIEGTFRLACEYVLKALKKGRETLLTLLEAFVYDPLVDWAVGEDGAGALAVSAYGGEALGGELRQARKQLEHEVTRDTLAIRFAEIKPEWTQNRDDVYNQLIDMRDHLQTLQTQRSEMQQIESNRKLLSKQLAMIREAETLGTAIGSHQLNSLSQRYSVYKRTKNEYNATKQALQIMSDECMRFMNDYQQCIRSIKCGELSQELQQLDCLTANQLSVSEFSLVKEFLENSAQSALYIQSDQTRKELDSSLIQQITILHQIIDSLQHYCNVVCFYPQSYIDQHRCNKYAEWCRYLCDKPSITSCREIVGQFQKSHGENAIQPPVQQVVAFSYQLQAVLADDSFKLQKNFDRLNVELSTTGGGTTVTASSAYDQNNIMKLQLAFNESKSAIEQFLHDENGADKALKCVTLTAICDLNKRLIMMENAAVSSGDNLVDLTLNGKWFLDELHVITSTLHELTNVVHFDSDSKIQNNLSMSMQCFKASANVYQCLCEMNNNFSNETLSNVMHGIISEEKSCLEMISMLSDLQEGIQSLPELLTNLHLHLRCSILSMESTNISAVQDVMLLRQKFVEMKNGFGDDIENMSAGQKLLIMFDELFERLDERHQEMVQTLDELNVSEKWRKIDQIKESRDVATLILNPNTRNIFVDIFFVKRIETMIEIFTLCLQMACAFKANGVCTIYDDDGLCRPLRKFIADYVWRLQLGTSSHTMSLILCGLLEEIDVNVDEEVDRVDIGALSKVSLEDLCRKGVDAAIKSGEFSYRALTYATTLCLNLDVTWRKCETIKYLQNAVHTQNASLKRRQLLFAAHCWMYEDVTGDGGNGNNVKQLTATGCLDTDPIINRANILMQLSNKLKTLTAWRAPLSKMRDEIASFVTAISQRLKWAVGANPGLIKLLTTFNDIVAIKCQHFDSTSSLVDTIINHCTAVLHYESMRVCTPEALEKDQQFLDLVSRWEKSCTMIQSCTTVVSPVEEALVEMLDPEGPIDHIWLNNVADLIDDMTHQIQSHINKTDKDIVMSQENLHNCAHRLRLLMGKHHRMASEVRTLLRTTLKVEGTHITPIKDYLKNYKEFLDTISELHGNMLSKDFTEQVVDGTLQHIEKLLIAIGRIFDDLFLFENDLKDATMAETLLIDENNKNQHLVENRSMSPATRKKKGTQTEQKRNAYAVSVWRRIRMKLEGRDPDPTRRCTSAEQVDWMIREAMNPDNLAVLYEGWTPWV